MNVITRKTFSYNEIVDSENANITSGNDNSVRY